MAKRLSEGKGPLVGCDLTIMMAPRRQEIPFDSDRKRMTTWHISQLLPIPREITGADEHLVGFTKGAVDSLLTLCTHVLHSGKSIPLTPEIEAGIRETHDQIAGQGMRILGLGLRLLPIDELESADVLGLETDLIFVGMFSLMDPPREEAFDAVQACASAGIRPLMITGDHAITAHSIGSRLGIGLGKQVVTGQDLEQTSEDASLDEVTRDTDIYARVTPHHKLRLVESLQRQGHVVAMTGDGVNDAPALKRADIGIAMGITGTDVSKEASDVVLRDDNFATIVNAIKEGRTVFDYIRKFIRNLLSANVGEILVMLVGPLCGMPMPLWPLQILWMFSTGTSNARLFWKPTISARVSSPESNVERMDTRSPTEAIGPCDSKLWPMSLVT